MGFKRGDAEMSPSDRLIGSWFSQSATTFPFPIGQLCTRFLLPPFFTGVFGRVYEKTNNKNNHLCQNDSGTVSINWGLDINVNINSHIKKDEIIDPQIN